MLESLSTVKSEIYSLKQEKDLKEKLLIATQERLTNIQNILYQKQQTELHLSEIYRQATIQFPRLNGRPGSELTKEDLGEIEKWISRAKTCEGLIAIVKAIEEMAKYKPNQIKNIYAVVQKIIIEGPRSRK